MSWFIDASAIVAINGGEEGWEVLADRLDEEEIRLWSAVSRWESAVALAKRLKKSVSEADAILGDFAAFYRFDLVSIGVHEGDLALDAFARFGKGSGHPARLNMGDCFAYACAKANKARLLYKGDDFARTDIAG